MTQEQKDLLLKDLCARLPYGVKVQIKNEIVVLDSVCDDDGYHFNFIGDDKEGVNIEQIKPYLFPMSSMTEEQEYEWDNLFTDPLCEGVMSRHTREEDLLLRAKSGFASTDYLDKNFFDYRGLIPMGLAKDATGLNIY